MWTPSPSSFWWWRVLPSTTWLNAPPTSTRLSLPSSTPSPKKFMRRSCPSSFPIGSMYVALSVPLKEIDPLHDGCLLHPLWDNPRCLRDTGPSYPDPVPLPGVCQAPGRGLEGYSEGKFWPLPLTSRSWASTNASPTPSSTVWPWRTSRETSIPSWREPSPTLIQTAPNSRSLPWSTSTSSSVLLQRQKVGLPRRTHSIDYTTLFYSLDDRYEWITNVWVLSL